ncbi:unnamed protein product [Sphagnum tenellum]
MKEVGAAGSGEDQNLKTTNGKLELKGKMHRYYDMQQQLELVLAAQELSKFGDHVEFGGPELGHIESAEEEPYGIDARNVDI